MSVDHHHARRLWWDGCPNARDLGGLPTASGGRTRWGAIMRSDSPHRLTPAGEQALIDHGVRTIVDVRLPGEASADAHSFAVPGDHGISYVNLSFVDPAFEPDDSAPVFLADIYKDMLARDIERVGAIMRAIADAPGGGVLIHCHAGKDRTGLLCALLLDLVGVSPQIIAEDYALTGEYLRKRTEAWVARVPDQRAERQREADRSHPRPEIMLEVLAFVDKRYGGSEAYLRLAGLQPAEIARLRARLSEADRAD
jgi:protein tyrosine/serine phosphatase